MSKRIITTALLGIGLAAMMATSAEARLDNGPISSLYEEDGRSLTRSKPSKSARAKAKQYGHRSAGSKNRIVKSGPSRRGYAKAKPDLASRAITADAGGGGTSRTCLQPEARALLNRIETQFGPVQIISTCRPGAVIAGTGKPSKHRYGLAIDFNAGGRKGEIVNWLIANHHSGGTMTYSNMNHIHVDIGPHFVSLGSHSRG